VSSLDSLLGTVDAINLGRRDRVVTLAREAAGGSLAGSRVAVLGVAFKPNSDDVRDSPSLDICGRLAAEGAIVSVHDPVAMPSAAAKRPDLRYAPSVSEAADAADLVLHLTEWSDYRAIDPAALARVVARRVIIDARCCLDTALWTNAGWTVGAGLEVALPGNWSAKAEYLHVDLGRFNCGTGCGPLPTDNVSLHDNVFRAGVNYRFGWGK